MDTTTAEVNTNTLDHYRLLRRYSGSVSIGRTLCPCLLLSNNKSIFGIETQLGAPFQISEFEVFHIFNNLGELIEHWSFPLKDGHEYTIQPKTFSRKKSNLPGWTLIQILRDANLLRSELSGEFRFLDRRWERICSRINKVLPGPSNELQLRNLIRTVMKERGKLMFGDITPAMVKARDSRFSEGAVYQMLSPYKKDFAKFEVGVYGLAEWRLKEGNVRAQGRYLILSAFNSTQNTWIQNIG